MNTPAQTLRFLPGDLITLNDDFAELRDNPYLFQDVTLPNLRNVRRVEFGEVLLIINTPADPVESFNVRVFVLAHNTLAWVWASYFQTVQRTNLVVKRWR